VHDGDNSVPAQAPTVPAPAIPVQRVRPRSFETSEPVVPAEPVVPPEPVAAADPVAPAEPASRASRIVTLGMLAVLGAGTAVALHHFGGDDAALPAAGAPAAPATASAAKAPTPFEAVQEALAAQAGALLRGDQRGWLAAVDPDQPKLQARYRRMYRSLRALRVSHFTYNTYVRTSAKKAEGTVTVGADIAYCFSRNTCPPLTGDDYDGPPRLSQALTLTAAGGRYVITRVAAAAQPSHLQPAPWENDDLVFAQGRRVTVAATRGEAEHLASVVALADRAAAVADRFARYVGNPQQRYRVYLAGEKSWRSWYGGQRNRWVIGYEIPLNDTGGDVVLRMSGNTDRRQLLNTLQHELGHVVTLTSGYRGGDDKDGWLREGVAEYIGWYPERAAASWRRDSVHAAVNGRRPTSIVAEPLARNAGGEAGEAFYGLGHFAVDCMVEKFGERRMVEFIRLSLRQDRTYDLASRDAFGKPFTTVDKACVAWIRRTA
jgi:hypothetical protein